MKGFSLRSQHKNRYTVLKAVLFLVALLSAVGAYIMHFAHGNNVGPLHPKGYVATQQMHVMFVAAAIVLTIAIPTILLLYFTAWKYRMSNSGASYKGETRHSRAFVVGIWVGPTIIMLLMAMILVPVTRKLDPKKDIGNGTAPLTIQVIALRWKWLFLYPDQQIATVNTITIPKDQPVVFELTADDAPMSSFWIPNLAGQLYAMTGHVNHLNVVASEMGDYPGSSAEINGAGFAGMKFDAHVTSEQDFHTWVSHVKASSQDLDTAKYAALVKPSEDQVATNYAPYADDLYNKVIMKYMGSHSMSHMDGMN